jgi:recombination protein RecA
VNAARLSLLDVVRTEPVPAAPAPLPAGVRLGLTPAHTAREWGLAALAGRLCEVVAERSSASLTLAFRIVLEAQRRGEPVAWIARRDSVFYPPDAADAGVDLAGLAVVRATDVTLAARAADHLLRSGGFGLVVLDRGDARLPVHAQTRLAGLAKKHDAAVLCVADGSRASAGSLVSLRARAHRAERCQEGYRCELRVVKDKRRGPGWKYGEICRAPDGLR